MSQNRKLLSADVLESTIRFGLKPNEPELLQDYLIHLKKRMSKGYQNQEKFDLAKQYAYLLFDTIADRKIPMRWRNTCSNNREESLSLMREYAYTDENARQMKFMHLRFNAIAIN